MFKLIFVVCSILFFQYSATAQSAENAKLSGASAREVFSLVGMWADAVAARDMKVLEKLFSEDLIVTTYDGKTRGKKEELEALAPSPGAGTISIVNEDLWVRVYGKTAVVTALAKMRFTPGGIDLRYTCVFVNQGGRWQMVALQTTRAPEVNKP
ncbi:MAG: nuclear transport factor 2 family protein [Pyrinomonadaceae bacterium]